MRIDRQITTASGTIETYTYPLITRMISSPHTLIAGTTGAGKSVLLNAVMFDLITRDAKFIFIDLKRVEMAKYKNHAKTLYYATEPQQAREALGYALEVMENRYKAMTGTHYEGTALYVVVDELADLASDKKVLDQLVRLGRLGRAAEVHMICATQDPSRRTLKAQLMQNFTCCVALRCKTAIESRQITGFPGAESLPKYGKGYIWDADGYEKVDIPMIPDEDLELIISATNAKPVKTAPAPRVRYERFQERPSTLERIARAIFPNLFPEE